ncbi:MAG: type II secretion system F family protein [Actinomycetota bacterium]|nr:type II secretion system F family protein [Actinomycetota bacterium]
MRLGRRLAAGAAAICAALLWASPADAAAGHISQVSSAAGKLSVIFGGNGLPTDVAIDPNSVQIRVGTRLLRSTAAPVTKATAKVLRTVMLVIDTSGSMQGEGLNGAKAAAKAFLAAVPADVRVGLVNFSKTPSLRVAPTTDRAAVVRSVDGLTATGETALYDGVQLGLRTLGTSGVRSLLLLSDGADTTSTSTLAAVLAAARTARSHGATVDAVGFKTGGSVSSVLTQLATSGGGRVIAASQADEIAAAFRQAAQEVSRQLIISALIPADLAGSAQTVEVTATAGGYHLRDSALVRFGTGAAPRTRIQAPGPETVRVSVGPLASKTGLYAAVGAVFLGLLLLFAVVLFALSRGQQDVRVRRRLSIYTLTGRNVVEAHQETTVLGDNAVARSAVEFAGRVVRQRDLESGLARRLDAGGVPLKPAEFLLIHLGVAIALPLLMLLLSGGSVAAILVGLLIGILLPLAYLTFKESRRSSAFLNQLPDTLQLLAGSLSAGYSFPQAVDAVVQEGTQPMAGEFNKALVESRLGFPVEDAMEGIAARMKSKDFAWVIMAVRIQREVGGNLAEVLSTVAGTLRERERIRRQVQTLSAEGKLSAAILFALPLLFAIYLLLVRGSYIRVLYTDPIGIFLLIVMLVMLTVGGFWLRKVVRVEV